MGDGTIEVRLLGRFEVRRDGVVLPPFPRRDAAALVKLLALARGHRLPCERVADALWPGLLLDEARPRLHKAAHYARRTLGTPEGLALRDDWVALLPGGPVAVDAERFEAAATAALAEPSASRPAACAAAVGLAPGELLPDDGDEPWTREPRARVRDSRLALLRAAGRWEEVLQLAPADEEAHLALLRGAVDAGNGAEALRRYDRMARALADELGVPPGPEATALRARAAGTVPRSADGPRLVERDAELDRLGAAVDATVATGRGLVVLPGGEAGSGKTALLAELVARVAGRVAVLQAGCDDLLAPRSLGPFRDLAQALPGELADALVAGGQPEAVFPALTRLLGARPTLLALEDVHWADDATVDAVRHLARRITALPAVLLLTCREDELGLAHPLRRVLGALPRTALLRIPVRPLSLDAVTALAGSAADAGRVHRVTRGNAFYVTEIPRRGGRRAARNRAGRRAGAAGRRVHAGAAPRAAPGRRPLAGRPDAGRAPGRRPPLTAARGRAGRRPLRGRGARLVPARDRARGGRLHPHARGLVAAHREVLDALLREPVPDLARVVHHAQAGRRPDVLVEVGPAAAADAVRAGAYRQAAATLRVVIEAGAGLPPAVLARLLADHAASLYYLNRFQEAHDSAIRAVTLARDAGDPALLADALIVLSKAAFWARGPLAARGAAAEGVALLDHGADDVRRAAALACLARSHSNLGTVGIVAEPGAECTRYAEQALELAERADSDEIRCQALFYVGSGRLADGDERGTGDLERSILLASGDPHLELRVRACVNAAGSAYRFGRFDDAERYVDLGMRLAEQCEFFGGEYRLRLTRAAVLASSGRWDDAIAELRDLLATPGDPAAMGLQARSLLARLLGRRGDPSAGALPAAADAAPEVRSEIFVAGPVAAAGVELAWLRGDVAAMPGLAAGVLRCAEETGHRGSRSELLRYLQRAGCPVPVPVDAIGPWAPGLAGRPMETAAAWAALGERYEEAVERVLSGLAAERDRGVAVLERLGAPATIAALRRTSPA